MNAIKRIDFQNIFQNIFHNKYILYLFRIIGNILTNNNEIEFEFYVYFRLNYDINGVKAIKVSNDFHN